MLKVLKAKDGDCAKKLFHFLNEVGARALRIQLGRVLEMAESSPDKYTYESKITGRFSGQKELELVVPTPSVIPTFKTKEAAKRGGLSFRRANNRNETARNLHRYRYDLL